MVSRTNSAPAEKKGRQRARVSSVKNGIPTGARMSNPSLQGSLSRTVQTRPGDSGAQRIKRKRPQGSTAKGDRGPAKRHRLSLPPRAELSEKNLRKFTREMDSASDKTPTGSIKRASSSRRSIAASTDQETASVKSQRSSGATASYRYNHLIAAEVHIHGPLPPADIQAYINVIIEAKVSGERQAKLLAISHDFRDECAKVVQAAAGEDDCTDSLRTAVKAMDHDGLGLCEKADWRVELKPPIRRPAFNLSLVSGYPRPEVDDASAPPRKRQLRRPANSPTYISPGPSGASASHGTLGGVVVDSDAAMPPPSSDNSTGTSPLKTPRPDFTVGLERAALISALSSRGINDTDANQFLQLLQGTTIRREPDGPDEPMLCAVPTQRPADLVFPFAVVEGKAYSTGRSIFEAENQAAVSGACGLRILLCLDELVKNARAGSDVVVPRLSSPHRPPPLLFFSICTQGPIQELWAHYTIIKDDVRKFNMSLLKVCHGVLLEGVVDFLAAVDNVLRWGTGEFLEGVTERLAVVAEASRKAGP